MLYRLVEHDVRAFGKGKAADARAHRRNRDRVQSPLGGDAQRMSGRTPQRPRGGVSAQLHAGRVNNVARLELTARSNRRAPKRYRPDLVALLLDRVAAFASNDARQAAA